MPSPHDFTNRPPRFLEKDIQNTNSRRLKSTKRIIGESKKHFSG